MAGSEHSDAVSVGIDLIAAIALQDLARLTLEELSRMKSEGASAKELIEVSKLVFAVQDRYNKDRDEVGIKAKLAKMTKEEMASEILSRVESMAVSIGKEKIAEIAKANAPSLFLEVENERAGGTGHDGTEGGDRPTEAKPKAARRKSVRKKDIR